MQLPDSIPTPADIADAARRIAPHARRTPVLRSRSIEALAGCEIHFKCENLQRAGAFKFRGACNAVFSLSDEEAARGVVTQSSGNHGAAVALACRERGIAATVVVPRSAPRIKLRAIEAFGGRIVPCEVSQSARDAATREVLAETGASYVHPFNDTRVIAGQATATVELLDEVGHLDVVMAPVSGGGLMSGAALAAHYRDPAIRAIGTEPEKARDAHDSLLAGERITGRPTPTICDGLRAELGPLTFSILREHLETILLADEAPIIEAMRLIWERLKLVIEPSCAVPLAALLAHRERFAGLRVGMILSGGNVDLDALPWQADRD
ncbi:threonine ammonia-lyase [Pseudomarimonas salicorniae]|uniref:Pyridoxal-phosphate dependent enzyme n=1 Tax=Pseudomarimonas salicorniae TaxID=2933270 RepID=A0ABT0GDN9_9GAMM|nr:pyridoxal-phosphate dependent enzyme [Lysobacter sp. CAU 1642]MCK7592657.1 pyridoxal-phosphate dependent enzyme [Lysobacter sp. CAU 1642]